MATGFHFPIVYLLGKGLVCFLLWVEVWDPSKVLPSDLIKGTLGT